MKTRFLHIIGFNAKKALGNVCKRIELCRIRLTRAKTSVFKLLNAFFFFSKTDIKYAKTRFFALKTRFLHIIGFKEMKALATVQTH